MLVLGLMGSPRKKGNTDFLLSAFMNEVEKKGAKTHIINVCDKNIEPCKEYTTCERKGTCPIKDDMESEIYPLLREADIIVPASPVFFYSVTAQLKALVDRSQALWARKYRLNLTDPKRNTRKGFMLSLGATKGKNLFVGINLLAKYFFDAVGAKPSGSLYYWRIENRGDMEKHPDVKNDIEQAVSELMEPFLKRKKIWFLCRENACRSQMAGAFAQYMGGTKLDVITAGDKPADKVNPLMEKVMAEIGIDMGFVYPKSIEKAEEYGRPDIIVTMGCEIRCPVIPGAKTIGWDFPDPSYGDEAKMREIRDGIKNKVEDLLENI